MQCASLMIGVAFHITSGEEYEPTEAMSVVIAFNFISTYSLAQNWVLPSMQMFAASLAHLYMLYLRFDSIELALVMSLFVCNIVHLFCSIMFF